MLSEKLTWGALPDGFRKVTDGNGNRLIVRRDREREIDFSVCQREISATGEPLYEGRGAISTFRLSDGEIALVRQYRHGGLFRVATGPWFVTWPPRPFRELTVTEELRRRGLLTVEVYAACVRPGPGPFYRGWLVTRELRGAVNLWTALRCGFCQQFGLQRTLKAVADSVRFMHNEGVYHRDLNLKNILVRREADRIVSYIIDFDRATLFTGNVPSELVRRNLHRLLRSARKLDPERRYFTVLAWDEFYDFYHGPAHV